MSTDLLVEGLALVILRKNISAIASTLGTVDA